MPLKYYGDSPAAFRTVNVANTAAVSGLQTLSSKLTSFSESFFKVAADKAATEGTNQAILDIASGKEAQIIKGFSYFGEAYNKASKAAFDAQVTADFQSKAGGLSKTSETPEQFQKVYGSYTDTYLSKVQDPILKSLATISANKYMQNAISDLTVRNYEKTQTATQKSLELGIENITNELASDELLSDTYMVNVAKLNSFVDKLVELKQLTPEGADEKKKQLFIKADAMRLVNTASNTQDDAEIEASISGINQLKLSPKEKYEYINQITSAHQAKFDAHNVDLKNNNTKTEMVSKSLLTSIEGEMLSGNLDNARYIFNQNLDKLNYVDGLKIKETFAALEAGPQISNANAVLEYESQGSKVNKDALMKDTRISYADKRRIISSAAILESNIGKLDNTKMFQMAYGKTPQTTFNQLIDSAFPKADFTDADKLRKGIKDQVAQMILKGKVDSFGAVEYAQQLVDAKKESIKIDRENKIKANKVLKAKEAYQEYINSISYKTRKSLGMEVKTLKDFEEQ